MKRFSGISIGAAGLLFAACASPPPADRYPSVDSWAQGMAEAECAGVASKCAAPEMACQQARKTYWVADGAKRSARKYTVERAPGCVDAWRAAHADGELKANEIDVAVMASAMRTCERVFQGTVMEKMPCASDFECAGDAFLCDEIGAVGPMSPKLCARKVDKKKGDFCANPGEVCEVGTFCADVNKLATCVARRAKTEACGDTAPCLEDGRCDTGTCKERLVIGQSCVANEECAPAAPLCLEVSGSKSCLSSLTFGTKAPICIPYGGT
ncbi:MAG: hypothetical protein EXR72_25805 [Myxococcales bacterium]|nr:hypothetical protein [Myxococcales bacterium]